MGGRRGFWCRISISGKVRNGCASCNSSITTSVVSGKSSAITAMATRGASSAMTAIEQGVVVAPAPKRLQWMTATVREVIEETSRVRSLVIDVPGWSGHRAGQHVDVRLTGEDGYQAQRSYSIASAPETPDLLITLHPLIEAAVPPYLPAQT